MLDDHLALTLREMGAKEGTQALVSVCQGLSGKQRAKVLIELTQNMGPHEEAALTAVRATPRHATPRHAHTPHEHANFESWRLRFLSHLATAYARTMAASL